MPDQKREREYEAVRALVTTATAEQKDALLSWALELQTIRNSNLPALRKAERALRTTADAKVIIPLLKGLKKELRRLGLHTKEFLWDNRGWPARLGLAGFSVGAVVFSGKAAGLATMGWGVAVPVWLVLGAGGTVLGTLIDELQRERPPKTTYTVIEAEREE